MNSLGDNRSSKILFGKRKYCPLQFLRIRKPPFKLFERMFCRVKTKKKTHLEKTPSTIRRKFPVLFGCFSKIFTPCLHLISPWQKIPLYNTEKKSNFVDVFWKKIYKLFSRKRGLTKMQAVQCGKFYIYYNFKYWLFICLLIE